MESGLLSKKCVPCEAGTPPMPAQKAQELLKQVPGWRIDPSTGHLLSSFKFHGFLSAMNFVITVASVAEKEGHHPDFSVHYNKVDFELWTHTIKGLSENDFILAAKINEVSKKYEVAQS